MHFMPQVRQLAAIMFTDIAGYTSLMGNDEKRAFEILGKNRQLQRPLIEKYNGKWIKELGDGVLASFSSGTDAVLCASEIQQTCNGNNDYKLRIGIHLGEVMFENDDVFGDGVNIASRLQTVAPIGGIWISESVQRNVSNKKEINIKYIREELLKNVKEPIHIYEIILGSTPAPQVDVHTLPLKTFPGKSIAILPFVNMSSDPEQEYFSDGISEEIINILAQIPGLKVPGRTSSFTFKGKNEDLRIVGEKLSVNTILEGSVRSSGNRIRITAQLINVSDGYHLWSEKFDRVLNDIFEVQDEIASAIVKKLQITLSGHLIEPKSREQTENVEAYKYYLKGRGLAYKRGRFIFEAKTLFEKALEIDPDYALAHAGLADIYTMVCYYGLMDPTDIWPKAKFSAGLAIRFGPDLAETQTCNALISLLYDWNFEQAKKEFLKALEINPGYEQARAWYGFFYLSCACLKIEEGVENCRLALATHPLSSYSHTMLALALGNAGQNLECLEMMKRAVELDPESPFAQLYLAASYDVNRDFEMSKKRFDIALTISNRHAWSLYLLAISYVNSGKIDSAIEIYEELRTKKTYVESTLIALVAAALGYNEEAMQYANIGLLKHDPYLIFTGRVNSYSSKPLRSIPEFAEIQNKMPAIP
jgi:adenylate cyclase